MEARPRDPSMGARAGVDALLRGRPGRDLICDLGPRQRITGVAVGGRGGEYQSADVACRQDERSPRISLADRRPKLVDTPRHLTPSVDVETAGLVLGGDRSTVHNQSLPPRKAQRCTSGPAREPAFVQFQWG